MTRRLITTGSPFERDYGYFRAVVDGDLVFVSGTMGYDYATMTMPHDVAEQARVGMPQTGRPEARLLRALRR